VLAQVNLHIILSTAHEPYVDTEMAALGDHVFPPGLQTLDRIRDLTEHSQKLEFRSITRDLQL
jgi:hypothetical protein